MFGETRAPGRNTVLTLEMIQAAQGRITPFVRRTQLQRNASLSQRFGVDVYLKLELFQKTGSFKPRGAVNQILSLSAAERERGVVGVSGGNFAQGAAYAARELGIPARICMAEGTPANYVEATKGYGAEVFFASTIAEAFELAHRFEDEGWSYIHPFAHPEMMAGNGTVGLEILEDLPEASDVIVSIGGGGLIGGVTAALKGVKPELRVWGVETEGADVMARSFEAGEPVAMTPTSLAGTLAAPYTTELAYGLVRDHVEELLVVSDAEAYRGVRWFFERAKLATELAAGCTLAAAERLEGRFEPGRKLVLLVCGGNVSVENLCKYRARFEG